MRCIVVGTSGTGKSTFARKLAAQSGLHCVELDKLYWGPNWTPRLLADFEADVQHETQGERWVVDGNYSAVRAIFWPRATHVFWLNFGRTVVFSRIVRRTLARALTQEALWAGNRESLRKAFLSKESVILWSLNTYRKNQTKYAKLRGAQDFPHLQWIELRTPRQAKAYLDHTAP